MPALSRIIQAKPKDLGGFTVSRLLPRAGNRSVGPFVFLDHFGPVRFSQGEGVDVGPHPHIGLATVTYLFEGAIDHRDSLGSHQEIRPGAINWMVAGRGIVHSERAPATTPAEGYDLHGIQLWLGLPEGDEETEPSFVHHPADTLPQHEVDGACVRILAGEAYGCGAPARVFSPMIYADVTLPAGSALPLPDYPERAVFPVQGAVAVDGEPLGLRELGVVTPGARTLHADADARVVLLGGEPLGRRFMEWNFVSSRKDRIEEAKADWAAERFGLIPGDEHGRIPLPDR